MQGSIVKQKWLEKIILLNLLRIQNYIHNSLQNEYVMYYRQICLRSFVDQDHN